MLLLVNKAMGHELIRLLADPALETIGVGCQIEGQLVQCGEAIEEEIQPGKSRRASAGDTSTENLGLSNYRCNQGRWVRRENGLKERDCSLGIRELTRAAVAGGGAVLAH